jgi:transporter family-2 protein
MPNRPILIVMRELLSFVGLPFVAMLAGSSLVVQAILNVNLRSGLASWSWAALVSYLGGTVMMIIVLLIQGASRPGAHALASVPWFAWLGGLFGGAYIVLSIILLPRLGAAATVAFIVTGQMLTSMLCDQYGLMGLARLPATPLRLAGALCLIVGVVLMRI